MSNAGFVSVVFPSPHPIRESRLKDSFELARDFAQLHNINEEIVQVSSEAFGFVMPADMPYSLRGHISSYGGKFVKFNEAHGQHAKSSFISHAKVPSKSDDDGKHFSSGDKSKSKANQYGSSDKKTFGKVMENEWLELENGMDAYKLEMFGTAVKKSTKGRIKPGNYFVLGIDESTGVATLSPVKGVADVLYNIDLEKFSEAQGIGMVKPTPKSPAPKNGEMTKDPHKGRATQSKPGFVKSESDNFVSSSIEDFMVETVVDIPVESIESLLESEDLELVETEDGEIFIYSHYHEAFLVPENEDEGNQLFESLLGENDVSMAAPDMKGGVLSNEQGQITKKTPKMDKKPAMAQKKESYEEINQRRSLESNHSRGLAILKHLQEQKNSGVSITESSTMNESKTVEKPEVQKDEFGLPIVDSRLDSRIDHLRNSVSGAVNMKVNKDSINNDQLMESLGGLEEYTFDDEGDNND